MLRTVPTGRDNVSGGGYNPPPERQRPQRDSNPCYSLERAVSWAGLDDRDQLSGAKASLRSGSAQAKVTGLCRVGLAGLASVGELGESAVMLSRPGVYVALLAVHIGSSACTDKKATGKTQVVPSAVVSAPAPPEVAPPAPADTDVTGTIKSLGCGKNATKQACRLLEDFSKGTRWNPTLPGGEGRWVGYTYTIKHGAEQRSAGLFWTKRIPTSQAGLGRLALKVGTGEFPATVAEHALKLIATLARGDQPSRRNQAAPFAEAFVPEKPFGTVATDGASIRFVATEEVLIRQSGRRVVLVAPTQASDGAAGDGRYSEYWLSNW